MTLLAGLDRESLSEALRRLKADAWLLFDFRHINPIAGRIIGETGMNSRRLFAWLPAEGECAAVVHRIELQPFHDFPGRVIPYSRWEELHAGLASLVAGKTVAMEVFPDDAVPYLDRVPHGVVQLITRLGGRVISSAPLVTAFAARWSSSETEDHLYAAEALAQIAREEVARVVAAAGSGLTECAVQQRVIERIESRGLVYGHPPIVAFGPNAAMPHYEPAPGSDATLAAGDVVLLDLWAGRRADTVFADQTWMGFAGSRPPEKVERVWRTVRDARDAAISLVQSRARSGQPVAGFEADRAARGVIESAGFGEAFVHRTGHSIDRDLHGSGPHLDDFETRDERLLGPGVGFSVEPGIYLAGEFGVRSEVNMYWGAKGPVVTPSVPQKDLIVP